MLKRLVDQVEYEILLIATRGAGAKGNVRGVTQTVSDDRRSENGQSSQWKRVRSKLRAEFGEAAYRSWLKPAPFEQIDDETVRILAPTPFMRDWIETQYGERLKRLWQAEIPGLRVLEIVHVGNKPAPAIAVSAPAGPEVDSNGQEIGAPLDPRFRFENFVVGKPNELAFAAARRVGEAQSVPFNPLFLYGGVGLGKTHLMHAIAWHIRKTNPERRVIYLSAEKFMYQFIRAMRYKDTMAFKEQFRSVDVLMIDDVQFIAGKESTQEEFFHTFNALIDQNKQIVISADRSPDQIENLQNRILSRLQWGLVADIHPTDYELRLGILQSKAERIMRDDPSIYIDNKVLEFLAHRISSNVRVLEGALTRLFAFATLVNRPINLDMAQECLADLLRSSERKVTIEEIKRRVADYYSLRMNDLISPRRARAVARPRQVAMFLCKTLTSKSLPEIGRGFGGRDHTTVIHAVRKIEELRVSDNQIDEDIENLRRILEGGGMH